ncbi:MAG: 16S rRNA (cytosine(1402)-N(4))-methyltransferase RsmH [Candidatus Margulisbacteria bacterium]|nr:16S rRNA (cytosine(1402)-N(4))-methyltransferase RsmH [Candidatus Margulisiibacteriota bacterium]
MTPIHIPVLLEETLSALDLQPTDIVVDGTIGYGGHSTAILEHIPKGHLIGIDQDPNAIKHCQEKFKTVLNITLFHGNFSQLKEAVGDNKPNKILLDLGLSSFHLDSSERGFSFSRNEVLDMRMNPSLNQKTAADILNNSYKDELIDLFKTYGDLHNAEKFVDNIIYERKRTPLTHTDPLLALIKKSFYFKDKRALMMRTYSQVFQALRIVVNNEFQVLTDCLDQMLDIIKPNGRIAVITFHSGEDRLVKNWARDHKAQIKKINKHVIQASQSEIRGNSRAKSAKLRILEKKQLD